MSVQSLKCPACGAEVEPPEEELYRDGDCFEGSCACGAPLEFSASVDVSFGVELLEVDVVGQQIYAARESRITRERGCVASSVPLFQRECARLYRTARWLMGLREADYGGAP